MKAKIENKKKQASFYLIALIVIVLVGALLRFINTPDRYVIDGDGIRDAIVAYEGARTFSFPLIGPFSSTGPYTFGPWYYISLIISAIVLPTPYAPWILMGIASLVCILLMADIGRLLYSKTLGIILAVITAIAPTQIDTTTTLSNVNPVLLFSTLSIWITLKLIKKEAANYLWYLFLGIALGMGINAHYQMLGLLFLPLCLWLVMGWKKYHIPLLISLGIFITFIPLLDFNLQTNWHTLRGLHEMYLSKGRIYVPNSWGIYLFHFWPSHLQGMFFSSNLINIAILLTFSFIFFLNLNKKNYSIGVIILLIVFSVNFLGLRYYWGERHDVYLYYLSPIIFILLGYMLYSLLAMKYGKIFFVVFASIIGWNMLSTDITRIADAHNSPWVAWTREEQMLYQRYPNKDIVLYSCDHYYEDHKRYLAYLLRFKYQQKLPTEQIAMRSYECTYPSTSNFDFLNYKLRDEYGGTVYPVLFSNLKNANFNFIDLSPATPSAIKKASWSIISTKEVFNNTVNWWK